MSVALFSLADIYSYHGKLHLIEFYGLYNDNNKILSNVIRVNSCDKR